MFACENECATFRKSKGFKLINSQAQRSRQRAVGNVPSCEKQLAGSSLLMSSSISNVLSRVKRAGDLDTCRFHRVHVVSANPPTSQPTFRCFMKSPLPLACR